MREVELEFDSESNELTKGHVRDLVNDGHPVMNYYSLGLAEGREVAVKVGMRGAVVKSPVEIVPS